MNYISGNKEAWEEAFEHRYPNWGDENYKRLLNEKLPFLCKDVVTELQTIDIKNKNVAQFCCNNGRELLSVMQLNAQSGVGFDIAENIIAQAIETAKKANIENCKFVACDILEIPPNYHNEFDFIFFTIGAITWFKDLELLFKKVSDCLKPGGTLMIHDFHPFMNMLAMPGEPEYDEDILNRVAHSYFRETPWIENEGMGYMSQSYPSKTFISFSHTMGSIINNVGKSQMRVKRLKEFDYDIGMSDAYDGKGMPLSFILVADKE